MLYLLWSLRRKTQSHSSLQKLHHLQEAEDKLHQVITAARVARELLCVSSRYCYINNLKKSRSISETMMEFVLEYSELVLTIYINLVITCSPRVYRIVTYVQAGTDPGVLKGGSLLDVIITCRELTWYSSITQKLN